MAPLLRFQGCFWSQWQNSINRITAFVRRPFHLLVHVMVSLDCGLNKGQNHLGVITLVWHGFIEVWRLLWTWVAPLYELDLDWMLRTNVNAFIHFSMLLSVDVKRLPTSRFCHLDLPAVMDCNLISKSNKTFLSCKIRFSGHLAQQQEKKQGSRKRLQIGLTYCTHLEFIQKPLTFMIGETCKGSEDKLLGFESGLAW